MEYENADNITDQQLVDYILKVLPKDEEAVISMYLQDSSALQDRLSSWETVLFQLNDNTGEVKPPTAVWRHIEKRLFEMSQAQKIERKPTMMRYLLPAFLSLCVLFGTSYYFAHQPTYSARVITENKPVWQIEGNDKSINFVSLSDISMQGQQCVAWLVKTDGTSQRLGAVPDTGGKQNKRIALPERLSTQSGDKVVIAMVSTDYRGKTIPPQATAINEVLLSDI